MAIVERYNQFAHIRQDLFGFLDLVAIKDDSPGVFGVQACAGHGDVAKHLKKLTIDDPTDPKSAERISAVKTWIMAGNILEIWSWAKRGDRGKRKIWTLVNTPITI